MISKKQWSIIFFGAVIIIYVCMLTYLLFFNQGLEIKQLKELDGSTSFFVQNTSSHLIKDIEVFAVQNGQASLVSKIDLLEPKQSEKIPLNESTQITELILMAPYHSTVRKGLSVGGTTNINLSSRVIAPVKMFVGNASMLSLELCNNGSDLNGVIIEEKHSQFSFEEENYLTEINLKNAECRQIDYPLTPKNAGETTIFFNIKVLDNTKKIVQTIEVSD